MQVIWQQCVDKKLCINIPFDGSRCVDVRACLRIILDNGNYFVEVEAFGGRQRFALAQACITVAEFGILRLTLCMTPLFRNHALVGVKLLLRGCIGIAGLEQCWTLLEQDVVFVRLDQLSEVERTILGIDSELSSLGYPREKEGFVPIASMSAPLTVSEIEELLANKVIDAEPV